MYIEPELCDLMKFLSSFIPFLPVPYFMDRTVSRCVFGYDRAGQTRLHAVIYPDESACWVMPTAVRSDDRSASFGPHVRRL